MKKTAITLSIEELELFVQNFRDELIHLKSHGFEADEKFNAFEKRLIELRDTTEREQIEEAFEYDPKIYCVADGKDRKCYCTNEVHCEHKAIESFEMYYQHTYIKPIQDQMDCDFNDPIPDEGIKL